MYTRHFHPNLKPKVMAVFFKNDCKFKGCGKLFPTLPSLIEHIEAVHINFDPKVITELEEHCTADVPLSYVLRYSNGNQTKEVMSTEVRMRLIDYATKSLADQRNGNHVEEEETFSESESSNDSWTPTKEAAVSEKKNGTLNWCYKDKPFACSVSGCKKRYKNINGLKYHYKNGHKFFEKYKRNTKQDFVKKNRSYTIKLLANSISQDRMVAIHMPNTSKVETASIKMLSECEDTGDYKWIADIDNNVLVAAEDDNLPKNEYLQADYVADGQWAKNNVTVIENENTATYHINYFNDSQNVCS